MHAILKQLAKKVVVDDRSFLSANRTLGVSMQRRYSQFLPHSARTFAWLAILLVFAISLLALVGWVLDIPLLKSIKPQWIRMSFITATCMVLSAIELALLQISPSNLHRFIVLQAPAILVAIVGLLTIVLYFIAITTGQEPLLAEIPVLHLFWAPVTRIALLTAILFLLTGCALVLLTIGSLRAANIAHALMLPGAMVSYLVPVSYFFGVQAMHGWLGVPVALNTGIAFCAISVAIFCVRPDTWLMSVLTGDHAGGVMARRLLPALLMIPLLIGWLHLSLERAGALVAEVNMALAAVAFTFSLLCLVWLTAASLNRADSKRQLVEGALRSSRERFRLAFENANIGMALVGLDGRYLQVNNALSVMFGYSREELQKMRVRDLTYPDDLQLSIDFWLRTLRGKIGSAQFEKRKVHSNGAIVWVHLARSLVRDLQGKPLYFVSQVQDITVRKQVEEQLRCALEDLEQRVQERTVDLQRTVAQLQQEVTERQWAEEASRDSEAKLRSLTLKVLALQEKERQQLSWELQEDLAQYITALKLELRAFEPKLPEGDEKLRQDYRQALNKINVIVKNLRDRAMDLSPQLLADLGLTVGLKSLCESYGMECLFDLDDLSECFSIEDQVSIYRVFQEAMNNASRHAHASQVTLIAKKKDGRVDFLVEDNGQGFEVGRMEDLEEGRRGIGLAAMSERIKALGGTLKIESQPGVGTRIFFNIPRTRK